LYYSKYCDHSKKVIKYVSGNQDLKKDIHFICIDKRTKGQDGKIYIVLENGQQIVMPETITKVPAVLLLKDNYKILYGDDIYSYYKPKEQVAVQRATQNNMEPSAFSFSGGGGGGFGSAMCGVSSDQYSFLDMDSEQLNTKGNGGTRQMHNYVSLDHSDTIQTPADDHDYKNEQGTEEGSFEKMQQQRDSDLSNISYNTKV
jgi:hypothetical protein